MFARLFCLLACLTAPLVSAEDRILNTEMCGTYFFIKVVLDRDDGRSEEDRTLRMLYDTGASSNFVDQAALARASGVQVATGEMARIHEADAGDIHFNFIRARVRDLSHLTTSLGYPMLRPPAVGRRVTDARSGGLPQSATLDARGAGASLVAP